MTPQEFVNKWANPPLRERQIAQMHFLDVCKLVGVEMPAAGSTPAGEVFAFETSLKLRGGHGFADVYFQNHFAIEYKTADKYKDLQAAYDQLLRYRENLHNPPLLAVTDFNRWEIHTNFPNTEKKVYAFSHSEIASRSDAYTWLRAMFHAPQRLHPGRNTEQVTQEAAGAFQLIADKMRQYQDKPTRIAYFLTKLVFCLFAEDVGLLPSASSDSSLGIFTHIIQESRGNSTVFKRYLQNLFVAMNNGGEILMRDIPYFNGSLFKVVTVEALEQEELAELAKAAQLNWEAIEPSIFGTLFERSLDPAKRSQLGAHYTSRDDILLIVEPVLMQPLRYEWETIQLSAAPIRERYDNARTGRAKTNARNQLLAKRDEILARIRHIKVLDPACGSGNFLYVALQSLMDLEKEVIQHPHWAGLQMASREVHPRQMYGIEKNPIAHALASIVVWIGYIQWRINNGYGQAFAEPILEELAGNIVCKDAILPDPQPPQESKAVGATLVSPANPPQLNLPRPRGVRWPAVDVIIGNPPFLGAKKQRIELGDEYVERLREHYKGRVPAFVDLACYWFEYAREQIENGQAKRAGLLATNSIRDGASREVLKRIKDSGDIFMAWSDREWMLDGAAVRISMVGFDNGNENQKTLDGLPVTDIHPNLTSQLDLTSAKSLAENQKLSFIGVQKGGAFDITAEQAKEMMQSENPSSQSNADVIVPLVNGSDIVMRPRNRWIIDFGAHTSLNAAEKYQVPMKYLQDNVYPARKNLRRKNHRVYWWIHAEARPGMRKSLVKCNRYICTPLTAKHRIYAWLDIHVLCDSTTVAIARDDDYFFGVLHSRIHETWALRTGSTLGPARRYTPTTTFETFPFPWSPGHEDTSDPAHAAISAAATRLHEERSAWLNPEPVDSSAGESTPRPYRNPPSSAPPPDASGGPRGVKDRTLTNLYNALQVWRGESDIRVKPAAADFAPRLDELHRALDRAVCAAYGWEDAALADEEELLRRLLALNLARAS